ncbi:GH12 family glycosyl hydrolase domain-containing protein [Streptacidiphilus carbonis]|uniref:GH12 family glycosyl hydrolase domain-containing protein n=1 Tax=Streptacidiphilus carbonis TaxID=105422 RepID=UPI000AB97B86|nr:cellulose binding domain-containing protein [Streptacidiphilus carbonis]
MQLRPLIPLVRRLRASLLVLALAGLIAPVAAAPAAHAAGGTSICTPTGTLPVANGEYTLQSNEWNSTAAQCVTSTGGTAWSVSTANFNLSGGAPATYPSLYKGCHWGACTTGSGLPIQISQLGSATSSWSTVQPASGAYDVAYDLWINSTPTTTGQPDGTEIMIWLNSRGGVQPFGSQTGTSTAAGHNWNVWTGQQTSWKIISYVLQGGGTSVTDLDVKSLISDAVSRGSVNPAHYLIDAEAGFEIWQGGQGLGTNSFSFAASTTGSGGGTDTTPPSAPAGLAVSATTSDSASLTWGAATDNVGVTGYDVYRGGTLVGTTAGTSYTDTGLSAATAYTYTVKAFDAAGNLSPASGSATATTQAASGGGGGCSAVLAVTNQWTPGFTDTVTVTNKGSAATHGWTVTWTWPNGQQETSYWNAALTQTGSAVTATNLSYNGAIPAGGNTTFGLQGTWNGSNGTPTLSCTAS